MIKLIIIFRNRICQGIRHITRKVTRYAPIMVLRVYEDCLHDQLTLADILIGTTLDVDGRRFSLAGVTMHKNNHYCAIITQLSGKQLWYDGLRGNLCALPKKIDEWFPSHVIYCQL